MSAPAASHTIILLQSTRSFESRSYLDFPTVAASMDGIVKMFEHKLNTDNPRAREISYDIGELFAYLDSFNDICGLVFDRNSGKYDPKDREWIKEKNMSFIISHIWDVISRSLTGAPIASTYSSGGFLYQNRNLDIPNDNKITISYCTDIEGNLDYWERFKKFSLVFESPSLDDSYAALRLKPNCHFVFGGDVCDRGDGDIRIARELLGLKTRYPDNVHLILGNRDINKLRMHIELNGKLKDMRLCPYWIKSGEEVPSSPAATKLQWMLQKTMGSPECFDNRKSELKSLDLPNDDDAVVESFADSVALDGYMIEYLLQCQLGVILHDTLFVHGAIRDDSVGVAPVTGEKLDLVNWVETLNAFARKELKEYVDGIESYLETMAATSSSAWSTVGGYTHDMPGSRLLQYGMGSGPLNEPNPTVVYSKFVLENGAPIKPSDKVIEFCREAGIRRVIAGHEPNGDAPLTITVDGLQVVTGDTSYAIDVKYHPYDESLFAVEEISMVDGYPDFPSTSTRGIAVSEVLISTPKLDFENADLSVQSTLNMRGVLSTGIKYQHEHLFNTDNIVGKCISDGWWVKSFLEPSRENAPIHALLSRRIDRVVSNKILPVADMLDYQP